MAPQQNSTLIDSRLELESNDEELQHFSPILPLNKNNDRHCHNDRCTQAFDEIKIKWRTGNFHSQQKGSRTICLRGVNSTLEQGNKEIPIWYQGEPYYISGVTTKTTCNDIIKALIDDKISFDNHNAHNTNKLNGKDDAVATESIKTKTTVTSRDYSDFVITESWRGIERCYDSDMTILPVWKAWSRVHNEVRLTLKQRSEIKDVVVSKENFSNIFTSIKKYLKKFFGFGQGPKKKLKENQSQTQNSKRICLMNNNNDPAPSDDILLVILPDKLYDNGNVSTSNRNIKPSYQKAENLFEDKILKERLYRLSETATTTSCSSSVRRLHRRSYRRNRPHKRRSLDPKECIKRRRNEFVPIQHLVRSHIAKKTSEVDELLNREYILTRKLTNKCKQYKQENELYLHPEKRMEISIRQIQQNVEDYAKEIIKTEKELLELKDEIKHDISLINSLKRLSVAPSPENLNTRKSICQISTPVSVKQLEKPKCQIEKGTIVKAEPPVQFVDNIYEFCDNNASMLV